MNILDTRVDSRNPITVNIIRRLINSLQFVCSSIYGSTFFNTAFSLGIFVILCLGEITSTNTLQIINKVDDQLSTDLQSFLVSILFSETDQLVFSITLILEKCSDETMCVFFSIKHHTDGPLSLSFKSLRCYSISVFKSKPYGEMGLKFIVLYTCIYNWFMYTW